MTDRGIALVTGASRGIGAEIARHLAAAGFDLVITARTVKEGERREHSSSVHRSDDRPLPGSLERTRHWVEAEGARCLALTSDLLDRESLTALVSTVESTWGPIRVLVNNGRYVGPGQIDHLIDTPVEILSTHLEANVIAPLVLIKAALPGMLSVGSGLIVNLSSPAGFDNPPAAGGSGGWGMGYAISKGAIGRVVGVLHVELRDRGIVAVNVNPGFVPTERMRLEAEHFGFDLSTGDSPAAAAATITWLATDPNASQFGGATLDAPAFCAERGLLG